MLVRHHFRHQFGEEVFRQLHDIFTLDERHLQVQLGELGLAVAALVFVSETAGDLEITLDAGHHQQLLQLLRRLGQGIELAGMHARRHQVIACAFRSGFEQDGGLHLDEAAPGQIIADEFHHPVAQNQVLAHPLAAQIQIAIAQAGVLIHFFFFVDGERRRLGRVQDAGLLHLDFDLTGCQVRVLRPSRARPHQSFDLDHPLVARIREQLVRLRRGIRVSH